MSSHLIHNVLTFQQEIVWKAVRAFWMNLVPDFERLDHYEDFLAQISSIEKRMEALEKTSSGHQLEVEKERNRAQQYLAVVEDKTQETVRLTTALRTADEEAKEERKRQHVLIARLRASVRFNRISIFRVILTILLNFLGTRALI